MTEPAESTVTIRKIDPRLVPILRRAAALAADDGHWLTAEHLLAALAAPPSGERSVFWKWWPRDDPAPADPYNGPAGEPGPSALTLRELEALVGGILPPRAHMPVAAPEVEYAAAGPDSDAYEALAADNPPMSQTRRYA